MAADALYFEDLDIGMSAEIMRTVMNQDVVGFAELSGDSNPVHLSEHYAVKTPFKTRIAHGLFTASLLSAVLGTKLPGPGAIYLSQTLHFRAPVRIGDVVTARVEVAEMTEVGQKVRLLCECLVDGALVLDGEAVVKVPSRLSPPRPMPSPKPSAEVAATD